MSTWTEECGARTRFLLGTLIKNDPGQAEESDALLSKANDVLQKSIRLMLSWVVEAATRTRDDMFLYDHWCPYQLGRTTGFWEAPEESNTSR
jgi:hypothetical protein